MDSQKSPSERAPAHAGQSSADEDWMSWLPEHEVGYLGTTSGLDEAQDNAAIIGNTSIHGVVNTRSHSDTSIGAVDDISNLYPDPLQLATDPWQRVFQTDDPDSRALSCSSDHIISHDLSYRPELPASLPYTDDVASTSQTPFSAEAGARSDSSVGSWDSFTSSPSASRRRRRRRQPARSKKVREVETEPRRYQCTFCTDTFKTKHDWQRHETTMHLSLEQWQCSKFGPVLQEPDGRVYCVFCRQPDPLPEHHQVHNYAACIAQPEEARQFHRKDHLGQHLRLFHRGCNFNDLMKNWLSSIDDVKSRCGFCDARMGTWAERQKHLAVHFRTGSDMREWKGDRGFEQKIDDLVENDMPVFLIGTQRHTMEPFSASRADHRMDSSENVFGPLSSDEVSPGVADSTPPNRDETSAHSYRQIERLLLKFVSDEIAQGRVPSDRQLQRKMSEMMYGPDNAWDQTWADNPQWLDMFRRKAGLISLPLSGGKNAFVGFDEV
ncbi:C2H2-type domain-containing protein [Fusarium falciforme]|uniref:C2H2-type domain-containing protein n=1 Tax=Fusarium falciforme TaxID=195108 RepID=UPI0023000D68|nr:C2H2-type domain-containing protein [Fusarium falciforme]WAO91729.1 C2H2-type domain-containing protein [Fusarium falciforme]